MQLQSTNLKNTMAMRYLSSQIDQLAEFGYSQALSLSFLNLTQSDLNNADLRIDLLAVERLFQEAAQFLNDPNLGLRVGHSFRISHYTQTGKIYSVCSDLKQVFEVNAKYQCLAIDVGKISYEKEGWSDAPGHFLTVSPHEAIKNCKHILNMVMGAYATTFNWLSWGSGIELKSVSLNQSKPSDMAVFKKYYACPIYFSQDIIGIEFEAEAVSAPLITHNAEKFAGIISQLDGILEGHTINESLESAVRASIRAALDLGQVSVPHIASRLSVTERNFRSDLKDANLKYRNMLDSERQKKFRELYEAGKTFSVISQELCYNDQAAFNRAFKRWYGVTPSQYVEDLKTH